MPWVRCLAAFLFVHRAWKPEVLIVPQREMVLGSELCPVSRSDWLKAERQER